MLDPELRDRLRPFVRQVRFALSMRGAAYGAALGAGAAFAMSILDFARIRNFSPIELVIPALAGIVVGVVWGVFAPIKEELLARSIDRRGKLADRLSTSLELQDDSSFAGCQRADSLDHLTGVKPRRLYPVKPTWAHGAIVALGLAAAAMFLLGNSGIALSAKDKKDREELAKKGVEVERIIKPAVEKAETKEIEEIKALARRMEEYSKELQKGRMTKEEALAKANKLDKEAQELEKKQIDQAVKNLETAQSSLEKMALDQAQKELGTDAEPSEAMKHMDQKQLEKLAEETKKQLDSIQKQLDSGQKADGSKLTKQERQDLENGKSELNNLAQQIKLSQKAQETFQKLMSMPEWKELMKLAKELQKSASQSGSARSELTKEQLEEMVKQLEELAKQLDSDEAMKEYIEALKESLKNAKNGQAIQGVGAGLQLMLGQGSSGGRHQNGASPPGQDQNFENTHQLPMADPKSISAKPDIKAVKGERREEGEETYIEVKGPSGLGSRSSVPYSKVLPQYKQQAEKAIKNGKIPKKHEQRVRDYFKSLQGGK